MKKISILGSTGSIGTQTLEIVKAHPEQFQVIALAAGKNVDLLAQQVQIFQPQLVCIQQEEDLKRVKSLLKNFSGELLVGAEGLLQAAIHPEADLVLAAIVGTASLIPTLEAIKHQKDIALANKELLVSAGKLIMQAVEKYKVRLLPVDSEHSAIMQVLAPEEVDQVLEYPVQRLSRLIITASGGPFRKHSKAEIAKQPAQAALKHPNWEMGKKITIDSATLMNKGLEVIEAHHLFGVPFEKIEVLIHPQSIVHSLVEYVDGSVLAQLGVPDMRIPIQYALSYPERFANQFPKLNLLEHPTLQFEKPDLDKFPNLELAYQAGQKGGTAPAVLNAANEMAVRQYLEGHISFYDISSWVQKKLEEHSWIQDPSLEEILAVDQWARKS